MAYDKKLAQRVRQALAGHSSLNEKNMFGGIAFMLGGHMACGVLKDELVLRLGEEQAATARTQPHVRAMDFTGRPMKGYVMVAPPGCTAEAAVRRWTALAAAFVATLPSKDAAAARPRRLRVRR